jgi:hypothetical protein
LVIVAGAVALVAGLLVLPHAADASPESFSAPRATPSTCDHGYGCPTSSTEGQIAPSCSLSTNSATPGTKVTGTITNIPVGTTVTLLFDGNKVAKETATADGQGQAALAAIPSAGHLSAGAATADTSGGAIMSFTVPNTATGPGHTVVFSGAGFSCDATGGAGFEVKAAAIEKNPGNGGTNLARTGMQIAVYLAVALVLIVVGLQLLRASRARRRRHQRRPAARQSVRR